MLGPQKETASDLWITSRGGIHQGSDLAWQANVRVFGYSKTVMSF